VRYPAGGDPAARAPRHEGSRSAPVDHHSNVTKDLIMSEAEEFTRRALQESMDLRDQGHSDD
jgi:hypothetical protein